MPRVPVSERLKSEIISKCNNCCCVCQTHHLVQFHHIDGDPSNNDIDNMAPLCPNCHSRAHSNSQLTNNLTDLRIKQIRDIWYAYCEQRKEASGISTNPVLTVKTFYRSFHFPDQSPTYSWKRTFSSLNPEYEELNRDQIIDRVFSTSNPNDLKIRLEAVNGMYSNLHNDSEWQRKFKKLCNDLGFEYEDGDVKFPS